jgi:hypothetical protein
MKNTLLIALVVLLTIAMASDALAQRRPNILVSTVMA